MVFILVVPKFHHGGSTKPAALSSSSTSHAPTTTAVPTTIPVIDERIHTNGPVEGRSDPGREKIQDVVMLFLNLINEGKLEEAASLIDTNYFLDLMTKDRPANKSEYMKNYVHLFEAGELEKAKVIPPAEVSHNMKCKVDIQLKGKKQIHLTIGLSEMVNDEGSQMEKQWFFKDLQQN
jgi:hypothetical protein